MTYKNYSDTDFIKDEFFVRWVKRPDKETEHFWNSWLANNPDKRREVEIARKFLEQTKIKDEFNFPEKAFIEIHENILRFNQEQRYIQAEDRFKPYKTYTKPLAAIIILLIISVGVVVYLNQFLSPEGEIITYVTKTASKGTKSTIKLPDGTMVRLNANSKIKYPESFAYKREVFLDGEAFFEVVRDTAKPFQVHCNDLNTTVLGTSFNVRSYEEESRTKIALLEGKVKVESSELPSPSVLLEPSEMVIFEREKEIFVKEKFNYLEEFGWKDGILYFSDKTLGEVFLELEQWYGVDIHTGDNISLDDLYEAEFRNETLENVLTSISYASDFDFKINGNNVHIFITEKEVPMTK